MRNAKDKGMELKIARIQLRVKQYEFAAMLGIGPTKLSEMESGRRAIPLDVLAKMKQVLNETQRVRRKV